MGLRFAPVAIPDAATYTVKEYNSGVTHIVPQLASADITISLPAVKKGLVYRFEYGGAAISAYDWVIQAPADSYYIGGVVWLTNGTPDIETVYSDGNSNDFCRILIPGAGTWVEFKCDGTNWYVNGQSVSTASPTMADT